MKETILLISDAEEANYLKRFAEIAQGLSLKNFTGEVITLAQMTKACKANGITKIISNREDVLQLAVGKPKAKLSNYAGSIIYIGDGVELLIVPPFKQLYTVSYGKFLCERYVSKFTKPKNWRDVSEFKWEFLDSNNIDKVRADFKRAKLCAIDIETAPGIRITSIAYTLVFKDLSTMTYGMFVNSLDDVNIIRELNATDVDKVLQNGKYDASYLFAYSAPIIGYRLDTVNMMHSWYSEFPKDLAFLQAFFIRNAMYWKDLAESNDPVEKMKYNCLDTWSTAEVAISWMLESPDWAKKNFIHEFTQVPICHQMEMTGIKRDVKLVEKYYAEGASKLYKRELSIQLMTDTPNFNPSSPKQTLALMRLLGDRKAESSDDKNIKRSMLLHPLNERILGDINEYRKERKELSTYLTCYDDAKEFKGRILYSINPHGTETGRKASKEHHFGRPNDKDKWEHYGMQIQNITADGKVKDTFEADDEYEFAEFDFSQAEARGVAYCSGDEKLLEAVESENDFHSWNASQFFGVPYHEIYSNPVPAHIDLETGKWVDAIEGHTINKALRNLSKRVNHGANYNMGASVLLDTMGERNVREAQRLLDLPKSWSLIKICSHLLETYERTYPTVKSLYYNWIKKQIRMTKMLVGATGWTRLCFGDPAANKLDLNSYVAHVTQSLNAMVLDEAVRRVYLKYGLEAAVKFLAQIHDSLFTQIKHGDIVIVNDIKSIMTFGIEVTDCRGITREMIVPVDAKVTGKRWSGKHIESSRILMP